MTQNRKGLTEREAADRLKADGFNELREGKARSPLRMFLEQLLDPLIYVLAGAAAVSVALGEYEDAAIIAVVVLLNAFVGSIQEGKALRALEALKKLASPTAVVIRGGVRREIPAAEVVKGDLVCLEAGCRVPADLRLLEAAGLRIEESALTGESVPATKSAFSREGKSKVPLGEQADRAFLSTLVTAGRGMGVVTATGMETELGRIAALIGEQRRELTPLQKRLGDLGRVLSILSLLLCGLLLVPALVRHGDLLEMLLVAISLAVAAVPEGLPAVVTICLALSVTRMARAGTIIRRLPSVETLGSVNVVCSDKTGTLTQNRMTVDEVYVPGGSISAAQGSGGKPPAAFLDAMILCNDAERTGRVGDPTELALLDYAEQQGAVCADTRVRFTRTAELPFDSDRKLMTTLHRTPAGGMVSITKGAPDRLLERCTHRAVYTDDAPGFYRIPLDDAQRRRIRNAAERMGDRALRTLAAACRENAAEPVEDGLTFLGLVGMRDPVRPEAVRAVETFRNAGVATVMITGDHADTALAVARELGIADRRRQCMTGEELAECSDEALASAIRGRGLSVFARVSPEQKVRIVRGFKAENNIVAMTGDGVNDAPSLKAADIGVAMGLHGTDVAKQAADMILTDDNFATIERAIEEGRGVYENIRKSVIFLLSSNLGEILTMFTAVMLGIASPLKSAHILWINLITDSLPALALGVDRNDGASLMRQPPRRANESLFARGGLLCTLFYGFLIAGISLGAFLLLPCMVLRESGIRITTASLAQTLQNEALLARAQTYAFTVLGMSQLFHAVGMRDASVSVFRMRHGRNPLMLLACAAGLALQFAVTEIPVLIRAFGTSHLSPREWGLLVGLAAFPLIAHECLALLRK